MTKTIEVKKIAQQIIDRTTDTRELEEFLYHELNKYCKTEREIYIENVQVVYQDKFIILSGDVRVTQDELDEEFTMSVRYEDKDTYTMFGVTVDRHWQIQHGLFDEFCSKVWNKVSEEIYCDDLSKFTPAELDKACQLLQQYRDMEGKERGADVKLRTNRTMNRVFLVETNECYNFRAWEINPNTGLIDELVTCGNCGFEFYRSECDEFNENDYPICPECGEEA